MDTFEQMIATVQSDLTINSTGEFLDLDAVKSAINRAKRKAEALFNWPALEDAQKTTTQTTNGANQEYYDYPAKWRPYSVWKLRVNGEDYGEPMDYGDYLYEQENGDPSGRSLKWANQWKRYFINKNNAAPSAGLLIEIWGFLTNTPDLGENADTTIFSYSLPICNEAIVSEAKAILKAKAEDIQADQFFASEAKVVLTTEYNKIAKARSQSQKTQPFFNVPNFFGNNKATAKGDFN